MAFSLTVPCWHGEGFWRHAVNRAHQNEARVSKEGSPFSGDNEGACGRESTTQPCCGASGFSLVSPRALSPLTFLPARAVDYMSFEVPQPIWQPRHGKMRESWYMDSLYNGFIRQNERKISWGFSNAWNQGPGVVRRCCCPATFLLFFFSVVAVCSCEAQRSRSNAS